MIYIISSALGFMGFLFNYPLLFQIGGWLGVYYCVFNLLEIQGRKESSPTVIFHLIPFITGLLTFSIENMLIASIVVMAIGSVSQLIKSKSGLDTKASLIQKKVSENSTGLSETPDGSKYIPIDLGYKIGTIIGIIVWSSISFGISIGIWGVVFNKNFIYFFRYGIILAILYNLIFVIPLLINTNTMERFTDMRAGATLFTTNLSFLISTIGAIICIIKLLI